MEVFDKWVAEFLICRQRNPRVSPANLVSALKLEDSDDFLKLKVTSVLRDISDSLIRGRIDERTLDLLEILEKLMLKQQDSLLMESHKSAYCWTAAECTLRFMWPLSASDGLFRDAVERIWKKRIGNLKESGSDLVTHDDLLKWETDLNKALVDPEAYQRIRESNGRYTAINFLNQLLEEQWGLLGSSSLESVEIRRFRKRKAQGVEDDVVDNVREPNDVDESMRPLESEAINNNNERRDEEEEANDVDESMRPLESEAVDNNNKRCAPHGSDREEATDVEGVGCMEKDVIDKSDAAEKEQRMGDQDQEHQPSFDEGDKAASRELKDYLLEIEGQVEASTRQGQEPNNGIDHSVEQVTPQPARVNRAGTDDQDHNETSDDVNEKDTDSGGTWSGRVRPRLSTPKSPNVSPMKKGSSNIRRPKKFWSLEEVEALREGVKEYGKSWKNIKNANPAVFGERTEVDLKDKWRNLVR
ncbi:unnamed protein product [Cochlearia groenlandica]